MSEIRSSIFVERSAKKQGGIADKETKGGMQKKDESVGIQRQRRADLREKFIKETEGALQEGLEDAEAEAVETNDEQTN